MNNLLKNFTFFLSENGYSQSSINSYFFAIKNFLQYLDNNKINYNNFSNFDIKKYKQIILNKKSDRTINLYISSLKKYINFLDKKDIKIDDSFSQIKTIKNKKNKIYPNALKDFITNIKKDDKSEIIKKRNECLLLLLYYSGLKTKDLLKLKFKNLIIDKKIENIEVINNILEYYEKFKFSIDDFVFFSFSNNKINNNRPITEKSVQDIFKKYKNKEFENLSITDFRKTESFLAISGNIDNKKNIFIEEITEYYYNFDYLNYLKKFL